MAQQTNIVTEIVNFKTIDGVTCERLVDVLNTLDATYLSKIKGYIDSELIKGAEEQSWILVIHWRNDEETTETVKLFPTSPLTAEYRSLLNPKTISLHFGEQLGTWVDGGQE